MRALPILLASFFLLPTAFAGEPCGANALQTLKNSKASAELRSKAGICLIGTQLGNSEVARAALHIIRDAKDDLFLREDLIEALSNSNLRHVVRVQEDLAPELGKEEKENLDRTLASRSASSLMAIAQSVKSMGETLPVTRHEGEFFRALSEIAQDDSSHVILREVAVTALEKMSQRIADSGVYEVKNLRVSQETLRVLAARDDLASFYSGAGGAYERLASAGLPGYEAGAEKNSAANRMISSVPAKH